MLPLYGFITAKEYEAILVHHFPIFQDDDVCVHSAGEIDEWFHELQNEVRRLLLV